MLRTFLLSRSEIDKGMFVCSHTECVNGLRLHKLIKLTVICVIERRHGNQGQGEEMQPRPRRLASRARASHSRSALDCALRSLHLLLQSLHFASPSQGDSEDGGTDVRTQPVRQL